MLKRKRQREGNKFNLALQKHRRYLLMQLREEWDLIQRTAKREILIQRSKEVASVMAKTILVLVAVAGVLTIAVVAPNVLSAFGRLAKIRSFFEKKRFQTAAYYLKKEKLVTFEKVKGGYKLAPTEKGITRALAISYKNLQIGRLSKWDKCWRIVIFDIPERHKWERECFRDKLKEIGFYPLQESVFVCPYPCEKEIFFLTSFFNLNDYVRFIETKQVYGDHDLRDYFKF